MRWPRQWVIVALGAALAVFGLALGAHLQDEGFLPPDPATQDEINQRGAAGYPVLLSGLLVAAGVTMAVARLAPPVTARVAPLRRARLDRSIALATLAGGVYLLVNLLQTMYPSVSIVALPGLRRGEFATNLLAANSTALPSALLPVFGVTLAALLAVLWALRRLVRLPGPAPWEDAPAPDPVRILHRHLGLLLLAAPFLSLALWGALRLVVSTPAGADADPYRILLPLLSLVLLGLLGSLALKAWQVLRYLREPRLAPLCGEAWAALGLAQAWMAGALVVLCLVAGGFKPLPQPLLEAGSAFGMDLRRHVQMLLLALVPLFSVRRLHHLGSRLFAGPPVRGETPPILTWATPFAAAILGFVLAGVAVFFIDSPLVGWMLVTAPAAAASFRLRPLRTNALLLLLTAWTAWCLGNSFFATYNPQDAGLIQFHGNPGVLALWRLLGAVLAGVAVARLAHGVGAARGARHAWPRAAGLGVCVGVVALVELPLSIWTESSLRGQLVAVGSAVAAQEPAVQAILHAAALGASLAAAVLLALLCRPDWFGHRPRRLGHAAGHPLSPIA